MSPTLERLLMVPLAAAITFTLILIIATIPLLPPAAAASDYVVRYDNGGYAVDYLRRAEKLASEGTRLKIDGRCASACLIYLTRLPACATPRAQLGFHMPYALDRRTGRLLKGERYVAASQTVAIQILDGLPPALRKHYPMHRLPNVYRGDSPTAFIWVSGKDAQNAIGAC